MVELPRLPNDPYSGDGYDWMGELTGGWYVVPGWGSDGWDVGKWPLVVMAHYDDSDHDLYGLAYYCEGDVEVKQFDRVELRNLETSKLALFYWQAYEISSAPKDLTDPRLGPYRG